MLTKRFPLLAFAVIAGLTVLSFLFGGWYTVNQTERGVLTTMGKFTAVESPGFHLKWPFAQNVVTYDITLQTVNNWDKDSGSLNTYTIDNQEVDARIGLFYKLDEQDVEYVFKNISKDQSEIREKIWIVAVKVFKNEMGKVNTTDVAQKRGELTKNILAVLGPAVEENLHIHVVDFQIPNIDYSDAFRKGVENAALAKVNIERALQEKQQAAVDADKAKIAALGAANAQREKAQGDADANLALAVANAKAIELEGAAKAKAMELQAEALKANPELVELRKVEKWNGSVPTWTGGSQLPVINLNPPSN